MVNENSSMMSFTIFSSILIALILAILPMPDWSVWYRPEWVLLVMVYWTMEMPYRVNIGLAWIIGIFLDVLNGTILGEHSLALTLVIYIVSRMDNRLKMFPVIQQAFSIFLLVLFYKLILYCAQGFLGDTPVGWLYWVSPVTSMIFWPWVYSIMRSCYRRFSM